MKQRSIMLFLFLSLCISAVHITTTNESFHSIDIDLLNEHFNSELVYLDQEVIETIIELKSALPDYEWSAVFENLYCDLQDEGNVALYRQVDSVVDECLAACNGLSPDYACAMQENLENYRELLHAGGACLGESRGKNSAKKICILCVRCLSVNGALFVNGIEYSDLNALAVALSETGILLGGPQGPSGVQGPQGPQGLQGLQGLAGEQGPIGLQGIQGLTGDQGIQGLPGEQGPIGLQGIQGLTGDQGIQGLTGPQGLQGLIGPQGIQGLIGPQGIQGFTGDQGIQGPIGPQGIQGLIGPQGIQGFTGDQGIQGLIGPQGIQGLTGSQGIQGLIGPQGIQGLVGPQGIQGLIGPQGIQGLIGPQGIQGLTGPQGIQGLVGPQGVQGIQGIPGQGGILGYGYVYNLTPQSVAIDAPVIFDSSGPLLGVTHAPSTSSIVITNAGTYAVIFSVSGTEPNQFTLFVNAAPDASTVYGSGAGTQQNTGLSILVLGAGDVLSLQSYSSNAAVGLASVVGGTRANVSASVLILRIA